MKSKFLLSSIVLLVIICNPFLSKAQTANGLVGHWKFDEGSGTSIKDELNTTNGELVNSVASTWTDGLEGKALDFSQIASGKTYSYAKCANNSAVNIDGNLTISLLMKGEMSPDGDHEYSIISKGVPNTTTGGWYHLSLKAGGIRFMVWDGSTLSSPAGDLPAGLTWDANTWYHIVGVRDIATDMLYTYLNGELISSVADDLTGSMLNDGDLTFGSVAQGETVWGSNYKGKLDEVKLFNVALTESEVQALAAGYGFGEANSVYEKMLSDIVIAPNPVSDQLIINNASAYTRIEIYNVVGMRIRTISNNQSETISANIEAMPKGQYILKGLANDNTVVIKRFCKN